MIVLNGEAEGFAVLLKLRLSIRIITHASPEGLKITRATLYQTTLFSLTIAMGHRTWTTILCHRGWIPVTVFVFKKIYVNSELYMSPMR